MSAVEHNHLRLASVNEVVPWQNLRLRGEKNAAAAALSKHDSTRAHGLADPELAGTRIGGTVFTDRILALALLCRETLPPGAASKDLVDTQHRGYEEDRMASESRGGVAGPPFEHYPASPEAIGTVADGLTSGGQQMVTLMADVRQVHASAQAGVDGDLAAPMQTAPQPVVANVARLVSASVFAGSSLRLFATAVVEFNSGVDRLNTEWSLAGRAADAAGSGMLGLVGSLADPLVDKANEALAAHLRTRYAELEGDLDAAAAETAGMLSRGPNPGDWQGLRQAGTLPAASPTAAGVGLPSIGDIWNWFFDDGDEGQGAPGMPTPPPGQTAPGMPTPPPGQTAPGMPGPGPW